MARGNNSREGRAAKSELSDRLSKERAELESRLEDIQGRLEAERYREGVEKLKITTEKEPAGIEAKIKDQKAWAKANKVPTDKEILSQIYIQNLPKEYTTIGKPYVGILPNGSRVVRQLFQNEEGYFGVSLHIDEVAKSDKASPLTGMKDNTIFAGPSNRIQAVEWKYKLTSV